jgi:hypothetical protein
MTPLPGEVTEGADVVALEPPDSKSDDLESIATWLCEVADDPVAFVEGAFPWGNGELANCKPEPWQVEILATVRDGLPIGRAIKIAVASGHGVGKTALICWLILWALSTFPDTRGIVTAATEPMLMTRVRAELRKWLRMFKGRMFFGLGATALTSSDGAHEQTWRIDLLACNPANASGRISDPPRPIRPVSALGDNAFEPHSTGVTEDRVAVGDSQMLGQTDAIARLAQQACKRRPPHVPCFSA